MTRTHTAAAAILALAAPAAAQELIVWHDKGDDGLALIEDYAARFAEAHPGATVTSVSMPTDQWFSKSIAALNTGTGPDILFNDNDRIATVQQSTGRLCDLTDLVEGLPEGDRAQLSEGDLASATLEGEVLMVPFQRVITAMGARASWLDAVGEEFPETWEDVLRVGRKFQEEDPDGNGRDDTFGLAMQGGGADNMTGAGTKMLILGGNRQPFDVMTEEGEVVLDDPAVSGPIVEYLKLYGEHGLVSPETINHTFTDMYQLIEGGRVGLFRVGNWNVGKWDVEALEGDYVVGPHPSFGAGEGGAMLVGTVRGMAVPCDGDEVDLAKEFVSGIVSLEAQQASLERMGGIVRDDVDVSGVTPGLTRFVDGSVPMETDHFLTTRLPWYPEMVEALYVEMSAAIASPPEDWDAWVAETDAKLQETADALSAE